MAAAEADVAKFTADLRTSLSAMLSPDSFSSSPEPKGGAQSLIRPLQTEFDQAVGRIQQAVNGSTFELEQKKKDLQAAYADFKQGAEMEMAALRIGQQEQTRIIEEIKKIVEERKKPVEIAPELLTRAEKLETDIQQYRSQLQEIERRVYAVFLSDLARTRPETLAFSLENQKAAVLERLQLVFEGETGEAVAVDIGRSLMGSEKTTMEVNIPPQIQAGNRCIVFVSANKKSVSNLMPLPA